jgi:hypothetical protein
MRRIIALAAASIVLSGVGAVAAEASSTGRAVTPPTTTHCVYKGGVWVC